MAAVLNQLPAAMNAHDLDVVVALGPEYHSERLAHPTHRHADGARL